MITDFNELVSGHKWVSLEGETHLHLDYRAKTACAISVNRDKGTYPQHKASEPLCKTCVANAGPGDFIGRARTKEGRLFRFPTLCVCGTGCGGHHSIYFFRNSIENPQLAYEIALIQYGNQTMPRFDNGPPSGPCTCATELPKVRDAIKTLPMLDAGQWLFVGGNPQRGIRDYARTITFQRELTTAEQTLVKRWLRLDECPGWTGIHLSKAARQEQGTVSYRAITTMDSSD